MWITEKPINVAKLLKETENKKAGACVVFIGTVREKGENGEVTGITYEAHKKLAAIRIQELEKYVETKISDSRCRIIHRIGYIPLGQESIAIIIRTPHRKEAYKMSRFIIDRIKRTVPIWKKEHLKSGVQEWVKGKKLELTDRERCK
ncbi:MAG: molybdenum cofactor biosynthesis protein MoaE [Planctomycetota bacterium]